MVASVARKPWSLALILPPILDPLVCLFKESAVLEPAVPRRAARRLRAGAVAAADLGEGRLHEVERLDALAKFRLEVGWCH